MSAQRIAIYLLLCALSLTIVSAQDDTPTFELHSDEPVIVHGPSTEWDGRYTDPGAALYHDGQFHMFRNGFKNWPASVQIGYLTSPDGFVWTEVTEEPVLMSDEVPFTDLAALASSALVMDDGTWHLYFYTWNNGLPAAEIGLATARDPLGPWEVYPEPVLTHGSAGSWDDAHVDAPSVVRTEDGLVMYYSGRNEETTIASIGMATSSDGIVWEKYDDPATTDAPYAESDPILVTNVERWNYHQSRVERTEDGYIMVFREFPRQGAMQMGLRYATSADGIAWTVTTDEPFWNASSIPGARGFWYTATAYHDGILYLYIEGGVGPYTDIFAASAVLP